MVQGFFIWEHNMADKKKPEEKIAKNRLVEADVTEISLVPSGAVEDADYVVLHKEHEEEPEQEDVLAKAIETVLESDLSKGQAQEIFDAVSSIVELEKEDTMEEEGTEDKVEGSEEDTEKSCDCEGDCKCDEMEKEDSNVGDADSRLAALEGRVQELLEKLSPKEPEEPEAELEKEDTLDDEDLFARAIRIKQERELAKAEEAASEQQARFFAGLDALSSKLDSLADVATETDRKLARACGREA